MKTVMILGRRSGTSLMGYMLHEAGVYMGKEFYGPVPHNPDGHFEEMDFVNMNNQILARIGAHRRDRPPSHQQVLKLDKHKKNEMRSLIEKHAREPIWGFKNPSTCFTGVLWERMVEDPHYIRCTRDFDEVVKSLWRVNRHWHKGIEIWEENTRAYWNREQKLIKGKKAIEVDYNDVLEDPRGEFMRVAEFLDLEFDGKPWSVVNPEYKHVKN